MPKYTQEFRHQVVQAVRLGESIKAVAIRFKVSESSVRRWTTQRYWNTSSHNLDCMCFTCLRYRHT